MRARLLGPVVLAGLSACWSPVDEGEAEAQPRAPARGAAGAAAVREIVLLSDPAAMAALEAGGAGLGAILGVSGSTAAELAASPDYKAMTATLAADLLRLQRADPGSGVGIRGHSHRLFDARWLSSPHARFVLIGVTNRIDRRAFSGDRCGELRLIYRLAYQTEVHGEQVGSRLPMTLAVEIEGPAAAADGTCAQAARAWQVPANATEAQAAAALGAEGRPLAGLRRDRVHLVLVNLQAVRWPSAVRPDLGGHAEYLLRGFAPAAGGGRLAAAPLENTPDVPRLRRAPALRAELLRWLRDPAQLEAADGGSLQLPAKFLAKSVISVTPRGWARRANRPFRQLYAARDFAGLDLSARRFASSPEALLRRLDDLTCAGCHQARAVAGFHFLGVDPADTVAGNALAVAMSPHLAGELDRRSAIVRALAAGGGADFARPFSERDPGRPGGYGAHCGLGDPGFAAWTCAAGLRCDPLDAPADDRVVGVCLPEHPSVGDPCEVAPMRAAADSHHDRVTGARPGECGATEVCNTNRVGFPSGMCTGGCDDRDPAAACGAIALLTPFNNCLARGTPFPRCLAEHTTPAGVRRCSDAEPCRDDYICARTAKGGGACIPPYFLFQMRVDGHAL